jgi:hypothetical protein
MEHKPYAGMSLLADIRSILPKPSMTRRERLEQWVEALEREPSRELRSIEGIEGRSRTRRRKLRADTSPLTIAFEDPLIRAEGLLSDQLGDAMDFFGLSHHDAHYALCSCVYGRNMQSHEAAFRVRQLIASSHTAVDGLWVIGGCITAISTLWILTKFVV